MLARIAHELYWLGRNLGRAEHTARMLDGVFRANLEGSPDDASGVDLSWRALLAILGATEARGSGDDVVRRLAIDPEEPASVLACIARAREGARTLRDVISAEMWEALNTLDLELRRAAHGAPGGAGGPYAVCQEVRARSALFWGLADRTMLRDEAHAFITAGGRIEIADMLLRMLRVALLTARRQVEGTDDPGPVVAQLDGQALALLHAVGGLQAFRRSVPGPANAFPVALFLLFDRTYPNAVAAAVDQLHGALENADPAPRSSAPVLRLGRLAADLEFRRRAGTTPLALPAVLAEVQSELALADADIADRYFAGAAAASHRLTG